MSIAPRYAGIGADAPGAAATATLRVAEPPMPWPRPERPRPATEPIVVDCSAIAGVIFQDAWMDDALRRLDGRRLLAPFILPLEVTSVALKKARRGAVAVAEEGLRQWQQVEIELLRVDVEGCYALAQRCALSAYDAAYLWLALDWRCPLLTYDQQLAAAAHALLGETG